jgi:hypothetical protein
LDGDGVATGAPVVDEIKKTTTTVEKPTKKEE